MPSKKNQNQIWADIFPNLAGQMSAPVFGGSMKLTENVKIFFAQSMDKIAKYKTAKFAFDNLEEFNNHDISSPIEQILFIALKTFLRICPLVDESEPLELEEFIYLNGVHIEPQFKINKYRVDFVVSYSHYLYSRKQRKNIVSKIEKSVIVECDSQEFHERTEAERRYEKTRDRNLQKLGYKIFRFTGSEIIKNPYDIAAEILAYVTDIPKEDFLDYINL